MTWKIDDRVEELISLAPDKFIRRIGDKPYTYLEFIESGNTWVLLPINKACSRQVSYEKIRSVIQLKLL